ncbi:zinc-binding dehydrogenase [Acrocarpospora catenulata]|uniref:zinc-binding dehydrogenase n=1 Tax=Acrocarpospora catenulata TaxID=2836182 RepID=UPI001BD998B3
MTGRAPSPGLSDRHERSRLATLAISRFISQRIALAEALKYPSPKQNLQTLSAFLNDRRGIPMIDRHYPFEEIPKVITYREKSHAPGKLVITFSADQPGW